MGLVVAAFFFLFKGHCKPGRYRVPPLVSLILADSATAFC